MTSASSLICSWIHEIVLCGVPLNTVKIYKRTGEGHSGNALLALSGRSIYNSRPSRVVSLQPGLLGFLLPFPWGFRPTLGRHHQAHSKGLFACANRLHPVSGVRWLWQGCLGEGEGGGATPSLLPSPALYTSTTRAVPVGLSCPCMAGLPALAFCFFQHHSWCALIAGLGG